MANQLSDNIKFEYQLAEIYQVNKRFSSLSSNLPETTQFGFKFQIEHTIQQQEQRVHVVVTVDLLRLDAEESTAKLEVGYRFDFISGLDRLNLNEGNRLPLNVALAINQIAVSTTRGIFYSETRGTQLHNMLIPLVDPDIYMRVPKS